MAALRTVPLLISCLLVVPSLAQNTTAAPAVAQNQTAASCGRPQLLVSGTRVVGGAGTFAGQLPWTVSVQLGKNHFCGGTLIGRRHVVSAAHCFHSRGRAAFTVVVGEHDLRVQEPHQRRLTVDKLTVHQSYKYPSFRNDIALLRLSEPVTWGLYTQPACLPAATAAAPHGNATVAGWGWLAEYQKGGSRADTLQRALVPIQPRAVCNQWFADAGKSVRLKAGQLCAGFQEGGTDACQGDSGGPLVVQSNHTYTLVGVVSAGIGCARPSLPGIYTDVRLYRKWIDENTAEEE